MDRSTIANFLNGYITNLLIYHHQRLQEYINTELELTIEYIYQSEFKKHFVLPDQEKIKIYSQNLYYSIHSFNGTFDKLLDFVKKFIKLQIISF